MFTAFYYRVGLAVGGLGGLLLTGCASPLPPAEYRAYLADPTHGLSQTAVVGNTTVTCAYRPVDLLVLQDLTSTPVNSTAGRDSLARAYASKTYCTLTFSRDGQELEKQFNSRPAVRQQVVDYLNRGIAADAFLITAPGDSVAAAASFYVRQFGLGGPSTVVLVFATPRRLPTQGFSLTLRGRLLGLGTLRFAFAAHDLAALPPLRYE